MKIVIVDDDILVSSALKTILEAGGEVEVTGTGQDGKDAVRLYDELLPDGAPLPEGIIIIPESEESSEL